MSRFRFSKKLGVGLIVFFIITVAIIFLNNINTANVDSKRRNPPNKVVDLKSSPNALNIASAPIKTDSPHDKATTPQVDSKAANVPVAKNSSINSNEEVYSLEEACKTYIPRLPTVDMNVCKNSMMVPTGAVSVHGLPIIAREVPAAKGVKSPIRVLLIGGIHGDELSSSAIVFRWLKFLKGPMSRTIHWKIAPMVNPDGIFAATPTRVNANGIDLNRNFPMPDWVNSAPTYWKKVTGSDPRRFPGKAPLSEPETQWIHREIMDFKPNVVISVHAPFGLLDFDGPTKPPYKFGGLYFNPLGVYPGSLGNYGMADRVPIITIELPNGGVLPSDKEVLDIWQDMLSWIKKNAVQRPAPVPTKSALIQTSVKNNEVWPN